VARGDLTRLVSSASTESLRCLSCRPTMSTAHLAVSSRWRIHYRTPRRLRASLPAGPAEALGAQVWCPSIVLHRSILPAGVHPACLAAYRWLLTRLEAERIVIAGDSAEVISRW